MDFLIKEKTYTYIIIISISISHVSAPKLIINCMHCKHVLNKLIKTKKFWKKVKEVSLF